MSIKSEFPMWSPHEKGKCYKRFTGDVPVEIKNSEVITIEDNRYALSFKFRWVEDAGQEGGDEQPLDGLMVQNAYVTIRTNSTNGFFDGDLVMLPKSSKLGGLWIIGANVKADYVYTPKQVQTYQYLQLTKADL